MARVVAGLLIASRLFFPTTALALAAGDARDRGDAVETTQQGDGALNSAVGAAGAVRAEDELTANAADGAALGTGDEDKEREEGDEGDFVEVQGAMSSRPLPGDVRAWLTFAANQWGLDEQQFTRIAWCESRWDAGARGPGGAAGVFQFVPRTWAWVSASAGYSGASPYDLEANVESAAWLMSSQGVKHWGCR
jgi:soluble lytic murein transglycosylase-like protein